MEKVTRIASNLVRKKTLTADMLKSDLRKCLTLSDLTFLSIGSMVGSGLYVLTGTVTKNIAGPSIVLSYLIAAIASGFSAICYAEFGARIPVTGSAYQFTYISVGEIWAFLIGWNVLLEHAISATAVAKSCSSYLDALFGHPVQKYMMVHLPMAGGEVLAKYPDFIAVGILIIFTIILAFGVHTSAKINMALAFINLIIVLFIFITGIYLGNIKNWTGGAGFFPYGFKGTISGASTLIFSYVGYEVIASSTEECIRPKRDVPLSLILSLSVVVLAYCGASASLTLMVPYDKISASSPFPDAYVRYGWKWAKIIVSIGALAAMSTSLLSAMFVVPRYLYAMGRDGLLIPIFTQVHKTTQVPVVSVIVCGVFCMFCAIIFNLHALIEFIAIGQLLACTFVSLCVIILRYQPNNITKYIELHESLEKSSSTEETKLNGNQKSNSDKASLTKNDYEELKGDTSASHASTSSSSVAKNEEIINEEDGRIGQIKSSVLDSSFGFLFQPLTKYKPGKVVELALLVASFWIFVIASLTLFLTHRASESWWIILVIISCIFVGLSITVIEVHVQDETLKTFKVPLLPYIPFISMTINIFLMLKLQPMTWARLAVWMFIGIVIYITYGYRHSFERKEK